MEDAHTLGASARGLRASVTKLYDNWKMDRQPMEDIPKGSVSVTVCELEVLALTWINLKH